MIEMKGDKVKSVYKDERVEVTAYQSGKRIEIEFEDGYTIGELAEICKLMFGNQPIFTTGPICR